MATASLSRRVGSRRRDGDADGVVAQVEARHQKVRLDGERSLHAVGGLGLRAMEASQQAEEILAFRAAVGSLEVELRPGECLESGRELCHLLLAAETGERKKHVEVVAVEAGSVARCEVYLGDALFICLASLILAAERLQGTSQVVVQPGRGLELEVVDAEGCRWIFNSTKERKGIRVVARVKDAGSLSVLERAVFIAEGVVAMAGRKGRRARSRP